MNISNRPISPLAHGIIDYALVTGMALVPQALRLNKKARKLYTILAANLGIYNAVTDHGAAVVPLIPFRTHYKIDYGNLAGVALLAALPAIRKKKKTLIFHAAFLAIATITVLLTNPTETSTTP